jgi:hypothetical protein
VFEKPGEESVSNVIDFLERLGRDPDLCDASGEMLEKALRESGIDPALRVALLGKDRRTLEALLGVQSNVCCLVWKEDEEPKEEEEEEEEEEPEEEEDKE